MAILHFRCKERRRTVRVNLRVPLRVHGRSINGERFTVLTHSHTMSLHGGSIELELAVELGETLQLENGRTQEVADGKIMTIRRSRDGKTYVGIEFISQEINFWHMSFPVPGARPLRRLMAEKVPTLN